MSEDIPTLEGRILQAVRGTLIDVIRDTTTKPGLHHPLSEHTREEIRHCLDLITARQREMAEAAGTPFEERPIFADQGSCNQAVSHQK
uniref:Segregation and condensation protein A n=1 Tax=Candidatus Kentrum sp. MB TaxID=2138164 RepID=A0A450XDS1_9GAMM|nr:MAG: hypothetical protein BECKMB1821G_GA0114241_102736 [Candidatus Kentron sp. MB]VFK35546.1 MAG: hypothetical protein BECKMB1821I_GA0114274_11264 [Candidatus Kentron sp. MB]VFK76497.1 MAG: hypothetical protein BECKMB1821H_GA0114242_105917 [Candidatus Kentron sp. MB]